MQLKLFKPITLDLLPPVEKREHDDYYDVTCELCYFLYKNCENYHNICKEGDVGYFTSSKKGQHKPSNRHLPLQT